MFGFNYSIKKERERMRYAIIKSFVSDKYMYLNKINNPNKDGLMAWVSDITDSCITSDYNYATEIARRYGAVAILIYDRHIIEKLNKDNKGMHYNPYTNKYTWL